MIRLFRTPTLASKVDLAGRTFVVTGATPGSLGYEVVRTLALCGGEVVATCRRDPEELERALSDSAHDGRVDVQRLDLADRRSVEAFADWCGKRFGGRVQVLVNNAGILKGMLAGRQGALRAPDGVEVHWRVNYLGTAHLTQLLLPMLIGAAREGGDARLVNVSSQLHRRGRNDQLFEPTQHLDSWAAYGRSKLAIVHMSTELHRRYGGAGNFRAVALHPGTVYTNMIAEGLTSGERLRSFRPLLDRLASSVLLSPAQGAQTVLWCATAPSVQSGRYYERCAAVRPSADALDEAVGARLWETTERWLRSGGDGGV